MRCARLDRLFDYTALAVLAACWSAVAPVKAFAVEPPITIPAGGPPPASPNGLTLYGWAIYPAVDFIAEAANNFFLSPQSKISGWMLGVAPKATAEWSNGIHTTTLFARYEDTQYLTNAPFNSNDSEASFSQRYAPLRDLSFTATGDYTHQTIASALTSAIQTPTSVTSSTTLANGNTSLPNGTIVSPTGEIVGHISPTASTAGQSIVNPFNQYSVGMQAEKLFGGAIVTLGASAFDTRYEEQLSQSMNYTAQTYTEDSAIWLGPLLYAYSDGSLTERQNANPNPDSNAYRLIGGLGSGQIGEFRAAMYAGYQGSATSGLGSAGGAVAGGTLDYNPSKALSMRGTIDVTTNNASQASPSQEALTIPVPTPVQVAVSSSSHITTLALQPEYHLTPLWTLSGMLGYTRVDYIGSSGFENAWIVDVIVRYFVRQNFSLSWELQYTNITSNVPLSSASRVLGLMRASYAF